MVDSDTPSSRIRINVACGEPLAEVADGCGPTVLNLCKSLATMLVSCLSRGVKAKSASPLERKSRYPLPRDKNCTRGSVCPRLGSKLSGREATELLRYAMERSRDCANIRECN